jgi:hypothetical protein
LFVENNKIKIVFKIEIEAIHGSRSSGYVSFDDVQFIQTDGCEFIPKSAWVDPTTTTEPTTPIPTEPPTGNLNFFSLFLMVS